MTKSSTYKLLKFSDVSQAEAKPGLYAWYLTMKIGRADLNSSEDTERALYNFAEIMCYPSLSMDIHGHLNLLLKGELKHIHFGRNNQQKSPLLKEVLANSEGREILGNIFELAVPLLSSPLYIGVAKDLKKRLSQHTRLIQIYQEEKDQRDLELMNITAVDGQEDLENDKNFAMRIVERKINPNNLIVGTIYPEERALKDSTLMRKAVEAAETVLNRMFYPILGKR